VVCVGCYYADLRDGDPWAFTFAPSPGTGKITIYAPSAGTYQIGGRYALHYA
jgi:hypothetical protein